MEDILIVVVLYKRKVEELKNLKNLNDISILFYDNSPYSYRPKLKKQQLYISDEKNPGVSKAYNEAIKIAKKLNKKYLLLLDQDTEFTKENLDKYLELEKKYKSNYIYTSMIGNDKSIYSPAVEKIFINKTTNRKGFIYSELIEIKNKAIINTGLMVPIEIIDKIGKFNEKIKLDFSDTYFIEKYKKNNSKLVLVDNFLNHSLSGDEGKDKEKELGRFIYYCTGGKEIRKSIKNKIRITVLVYSRAIRLTLKYKSLNPIFSLLKYYIGDKKI